MSRPGVPVPNLLPLQYDCIGANSWQIGEYQPGPQLSDEQGARPLVTHAERLNSNLLLLYQALLQTPLSDAFMANAARALGRWHMLGELGNACSTGRLYQQVSTYVLDKARSMYDLPDADIDPALLPGMQLTRLGDIPVDQLIAAEPRIRRGDPPRVVASGGRGWGNFSLERMSRFDAHGHDSRNIRPDDNSEWQRQLQHQIYSFLFVVRLSGPEGSHLWTQVGSSSSPALP